MHSNPIFHAQGLCQVTLPVRLRLLTKVVQLMSLVKLISLGLSWHDGSRIQASVTSHYSKFE